MEEMVATVAMAVMVAMEEMEEMVVMEEMAVMEEMVMAVTTVVRPLSAKIAPEIARNGQKLADAREP